MKTPFLKVSRKQRADRRGRDWCQTKFSLAQREKAGYGLLRRQTLSFPLTHSRKHSAGQGLPFFPVMEPPQSCQHRHSGDICQIKQPNKNKTKKKNLGRFCLQIHFVTSACFVFPIRPWGKQVRGYPFRQVSQQAVGMKSGSQ